jgi:signal transduction histidine kinase
MPRAAADSYASIVARAIFEERFSIAARWLARLNEILDVGPQDVFPTDQLLDHIPLLISEVAVYLSAPSAEEIAANTSVIEKARELGLLRHAQRASVHQLLREYEILGEILEEFIAVETNTRQLAPTVTECFDLLRRLSRSVRTLMRTTVDTFVAEYTATLQERNERIDKFNRMTSHELRTPIGALVFATTLLDADIVKNDSQRLAQVARVIKNNVERLSWLIHNVQRIARLDEPLDVPSQQRVEVSPLATDVGRQLAEMAAARDVEIQIQPALPTIFTDPARLELILLNLISNAIKYSDPNKPRRVIVIGGTPVIEAGGPWNLFVRDNGLGIPEADQSTIFERFVRAHEHLDTKLGITGSGLGLSIVADCVTALGGSVRCESRPGHGTEFVITLHGVEPPTA